MSVWSTITRWAGIARTPDRSHRIVPVVDANKDYTKFDRWEFMGTMRDLERNDAFVNRVLDLQDTYVFGPDGLHLYTRCPDEEWAKVANDTFARWQRRGDIASRRTFGQLQRLIGRAWGVDGECFILLTSEEVNGKRYPRYQVMEAHRNETPPEQESLGAYPNIQDGIEIDRATGRPVGYWFTYYTSTNEKRHYRYDARNVVHVADPSRIGQHHSPSQFYPVITEIQDLREWQHLMMLKQKDSAETSKIYTTKDGSKGMDQLRSRFAENAIQSPDQSLDERVSTLRQVLGARTVNLRAGETYQEFQSNQPADQAQRFWETVAARACAGVNLPFEIVYPRSLQGTVARAVFDMAHDHFAQLSHMFAEHLFRVWRYVIRMEAVHDERLRPLPDGWDDLGFVAPKAINVDVGRNSQATLAELDAGITTMRDICAARGKDWKEQLRQRRVEMEMQSELPNQEAD